MKKHYLILTILILLSIPLLSFLFDDLYLVLPGWHTTLMPRYYLFTMAAFALVLPILLWYYLSLKQVRTINKVIMVSHLLITSFGILYIKAPLLFLNVDPTDARAFQKAVEFRTQVFRIVLPVVRWIQLLLVYYIFLVVRHLIRTKGRKVIAQ